MILIVIPARLKSIRLPNKPLTMIGDYPLLWWTWKKAKESKLADRVVIATDSSEIQSVMQNYGAECWMTSESCQSGSDRVYEIATKIPQAQIIVNLQGDEPLMELAMLDGTIKVLLENPQFLLATAVCPFINQEDWQNSNHVKAVFNEAGQALYFSRAPLAGAWLHLGLYVFTKAALEQFCSLPIAHLEQQESLEQLRAIEALMPIGVYKAASTTKEHFGVDTPEDLERVRKIIGHAES
jgi:3-deoxy-D-manno-octulosonate cytidylyltransferase